MKFENPLKVQRRKSLERYYNSIDGQEWFDTPDKRRVEWFVWVGILCWVYSIIWGIGIGMTIAPEVPMTMRTTAFISLAILFIVKLAEIAFKENRPL